MTKFNLASDNWIKVLSKHDNTLKTVSLKELFTNANEYSQLAGETAAQNLSVLRWLVAITTTAYSRKNAANQAYSADELPQQLCQTWQQVFTDKSFAPTVTSYLDEHESEFNFDNCVQVDLSTYNELLNSKKKLDDNKIAKGTGAVPLSLINRTVTESSNSPALFAQRKDAQAKQEMSLADLTRWLITYQQITGTTEKTKVELPEDYAKATGWMYRFKPLYVTGATLFDTIMLNTVLVPTHSDVSFEQKPVWEWHDKIAYIKQLANQPAPNNVSAINTLWSRLLYVTVNDDHNLQVFSTKLPVPDSTNAWAEMMTAWHETKVKKGEPQTWYPANQLAANEITELWYYYHDYLTAEQPIGVLAWLKRLINQQLLAIDTNVNLATAHIIDDGNVTSRMPTLQIANSTPLPLKLLQLSTEQINQLLDLTKFNRRIYQQTARAVRPHETGLVKDPRISPLKNRTLNTTLAASRFDYLQWAQQLDVNGDLTQQNQALYALLETHLPASYRKVELPEVQSNGAIAIFFSNLSKSEATPDLLTAVAHHHETTPNANIKYLIIQVAKYSNLKFTDKMLQGIYLTLKLIVAQQPKVVPLTYARTNAYELMAQIKVYLYHHPEDQIKFERYQKLLLAPQSPLGFRLTWLKLCQALKAFELAPCNYSQLAQDLTYSNCDQIKLRQLQTKWQQQLA